MDYTNLTAADLLDLQLSEEADISIGMTETLLFHENHDFAE